MEIKTHTEPPKTGTVVYGGDLNILWIHNELLHSASSERVLRIVLTVAGHIVDHILICSVIQMWCMSFFIWYCLCWVFLFVYKSLWVHQKCMHLQFHPFFYQIISILLIIIHLYCWTLVLHSIWVLTVNITPTCVRYLVILYLFLLRIGLQQNKIVPSAFEQYICQVSVQNYYED